MENNEFVQLKTPFESGLDKSMPYAEYPRPSLVRDSYMCLNGPWDFFACSNGKLIELGSITVPFVPQSRLSGVANYKNFNIENFAYKRTFKLEEGFNKGRVILHFGACDQIASVYVNGLLAGENVGGYLPFSFDITKMINEGENTISVYVTDQLETDIPYGKQSKNRGGMWYTPISGIWQTVWLESVPEQHIHSIKATVDMRGATLEISGISGNKKIIFEGENEYLNCEFKGNRVRIEPKQPHLWSPDDPYLYRFTVIAGEDTVRSYFALRKVSIKKVGGHPRILLNDKPFFFNGLLDQGYYSDGIFLPATVKGFENDILTMKSLGFNMLRKHIKIEPEIFYYYCDIHGMLVFQDMVNSGKYSFFWDTALPTAFLKKGVSHKATPLRMETFEKMFAKMINHLYNHPCVVYYTIFNEGWGQFNEKDMYAIGKTLDKHRIWDTASGWFRTKHTDVKSDHIYFKSIKYKKRPSDKPRILSEFGGYSCIVPDHIFNPAKNYGYKTFKTQQELTNAIKDLYTRQIVPAIKRGLCGTVYTQVSDVEDETNGIFTYDRQVLKPDAETIKSVNEFVYQTFNQQFEEK